MEHIKRERIGKHQANGHGVCRYVPYIQQSGTSAGTQANTGTSANQNTFTPGQTGVQGQLGDLWSSFMQGNIPSSFTTPQAPMNAYTSNFNQNVAPQIASQYGAGSPQIASQEALGMQQLQGNLYNTGVNNYANALTGGTNYGLGMPTGGAGATTGTAVNAGQTQSTSGINPLAFALQALMAGTSGGGSLSDERLKKDIKPIDKEKAIEQIKKLRSVEFNWNENSLIDDPRLQLGFIAQEVEKVIPEAVIAGNAGDVYLLDKQVIIPVLVAAVQELTERLERLENAKMAH